MQLNSTLFTVRYRMNRKNMISRFITERDAVSFYEEMIKSNIPADIYRGSKLSLKAGD